MGYDTHIVIGELTKIPVEEYKRDLDRPYLDGSGFEYEVDAEGSPVPTGRLKSYLLPAVHFDMCKIYDSNLEALHHKHKKMVGEKPQQVVYFFHSDGNTEFIEDGYGDPLITIPFDEVLQAVCLDAEYGAYRRYHWLKGLLEAMESTKSDNTVCVFYGD